MRLLRVAAFLVAATAVLTACPTPFGYYAAGNKFVKDVQTAETTPAQAAASPTFSVVPAGGGAALTPVDGAVTGSTDLTISIECATAGSQVFYTTDGTTPDPYHAGTQLYSEPVSVKGNGTQLTIVATALAPLQNPSAFSQLSATVSYTPVISSATAGPGQITVTWQPVGGASSYNLYYASGSTVTVASGTKISGVSSPHTVSSLNFGTQYAFILTAVSAAGESAPSPVVTASPAMPAPTGLAVGVANSAAMNVSWNPVTGASGYQLYSDTSATGSFTTLAYSGSVSSGVSVSGLLAGRAYYFKVRAYDSSGTAGAFSSVASGTTLDWLGMPVLITPGTGFTPPTQLPSGAPANDYWLSLDKVSFPHIGWVEGGYTYVVFPQDYQNWVAFAIGCYDSFGNMVGQWVYNTDRYINAAKIDSTNGYIVLTGQSTTTNVIWGTIQQ